MDHILLKAAWWTKRQLHHASPTVSNWNISQAFRSNVQNSFVCLNQGDSTLNQKSLFQLATFEHPRCATLCPRHSLLNYTSLNWYLTPTILFKADLRLWVPTELSHCLHATSSPKRLAPALLSQHPLQPLSPSWERRKGRDLKLAIPLAGWRVGRLAWKA